MKDQVDALAATGVPATFLNSSLERRRDRGARLRGLHEGEYRLLYAAPERLHARRLPRRPAQAGTSARIAIDEAHCISEWGHDFRPEYRQLAELREPFPGPVMALTATATERVRADIVESLELREPAVYVGQLQPAQPHLPGRAQGPAVEQILAFLRPRAATRAASSTAQSRDSAERWPSASRGMA